MPTNFKLKNIIIINWLFAATTNKVGAQSKEPIVVSKKLCVVSQKFYKKIPKIFKK